jgi:hypothetical protein
MGQDLESRMCQHLPAPTLHQILHITMEMSCCVVLSPAVLLVYGEEPASPYPARVSSNMGHWQWCQLARDGQAQAHFGWRTWHAWLSERPDCAVQFSSLVILGHAIQHCVISAEGQMNASMTRQPLKCDRGTNCLHFSNAADGWWREHAWLFGYRWARVESTLHKLFYSQSCWWGYGKHLLVRFQLLIGWGRLFAFSCLNSFV